MNEDSMKELERLRKQISQQEKMASLGLLSAGIAHEIQDDLNNDQAGDPSSPVVIHRQDNQDPVGQYELLYDLQLYFERCYISNVEVCHINKCLLPL
jgi:C4-dicarboxylate-specific signal transduction histidine kinase